MFAVKPLPDKALQKEICETLGCEYNDSTMAYFAAELSEDRSKITDIIGICQFTLGKDSEIVTLCPASGREDDEAMIVMQRAVMSFMHRFGAKTVTMKNSAGPEKLLKACKLSKRDDGFYADLDEFYKSPCHYEAN